MQVEFAADMGDLWYDMVTDGDISCKFDACCMVRAFVPLAVYHK